VTLFFEVVLLLIKLLLILPLLVMNLASASDSLSYSGRLVNADGSPVPGPVDLKAELLYTNDTTTVLCSKYLSTVGLTNGVFHIKLDLDCSPKTITQVLAETPSTHSAAIRIIDETDPAAPKAYSFQALHSMPYSTVSKQLVQMGATDGQVLTWDSGSWKPLAPAALESGSVGTNELADGSVTDPKVASGISRSKLAVGNPNYVLINDGSGYVSETPFLSIAQGGTGATTVDGVFANLGLGTAAKADLGLTTGNALAFDDMKFCLETEKLMLTAAPTVQWICAPENSPEDSTKLPLAGGTMSGTIDMNTNRILGLPAPVDPNEAVSKAYVDTLHESKWKTSGSNIHYDAGNVGIGTSTPAEKLDVAGNIALTGKVRLKSDTANFVELKAPLSLGSTLTFSLPNTYGTADYALVTDGAGNLSWGELANTSTAVGGDLTGTISDAQIASGAIVNSDISATAEIDQSKIANLTTDLAGKEPTIAAGTTVQYWRGDKSWQTLDTTAVAEGANLYFTEPRVLGTDLAGLSTLPGTVSSTDTVLTAIGKLAGNQSNYVLKAGDTMSGVLNMGTNKITGVVDPTLASDAATKNYVDARIDATASKWTLNGSDIYFNTGKVGIGTNTPNASLNVATPLTGSINTRLVTGNSNSDTVDVTGLTGDIYLDHIVSATYTASAATTLSTPATFKIDGAPNVSDIDLTTGNPLALWVQKDDVSFGGDVGIGTTSPSGKLHVSGGNIEVSAGNGFGTLMGSATSERGIYPSISGINSLGGLGPSSPWDSGMLIRSDEAINFVETDANSLIGYMDVNNKNFIWDGNVGIGMTTPSSKLHIGGGNAQFDLGYGPYWVANTDLGFITFRSTSDAVGDSYLEIGTRDNSDEPIIFTQTAKERMRIHTNGYVGIGTSTPGYRLHVIGAAGLSTGTAWTNASDRRLKDIQGDYQHGLEEILKLKTVKYRYKKDNPLNLPSDKEVVGFIAQEVQEVIPEAVNEREDGYLELNVDPIHWAAVNAIQELNEKQNACTTKTAKINRTIASLYEEVAELREKDQKKDQKIEALKEENKAIKAFLCSQNASAPFCP
jgi:hypothetical protein